LVSAAVSAQDRRDAEALYESGLARFEAGDAEGAMRDWQRALESFPGHRESRERLCAEHLTRGLAAFSRGALEEAILSWETAVRLDPEDSRATGYLQRAREQLARSDEIREEQVAPQPERSR
jgi:tetratricopeptide (TPR) repeat protein